MGMIKIPNQSRKFFFENLDEIFDNGALAEGKWNKQVNEWIREYTGSSFSEVFNSNGSGIFSILSVLREYKNKTDFFIQANTMYGVKTMGVASGLTYRGAVPCQLDMLMPNTKDVTTFISNLPNPKNTVFLLTHIGGWVNPDIEEIVNICDEAGVTVVEDCAHSIGATLNGKHTGLFGIAGVYSLYATKAIPVGEGGIMVTNDEELSNLVSRFIIYDRFQQEMEIGINVRMSEVNALLAYSVLKQTEEIINNKQVIAKKFIEACKKNNYNYLDPNSNGQRSNLYKFILIDRTGSKGAIFSSISQRTSPVYDYSLGDDPHDICNHHICLPVWYNLDDETIQRTIIELEKS